MRNIPSTTGPSSLGETSREDGDIANSFAGKAFYEDLIEKANSVPITIIFKHYGVRLDNENLKTTCPFASHKGGRERTPSFNYYPNTNTYYCFGCAKGTTCCDFVAEKERISHISAAYKIIELFGSYASDECFCERENFSERFEIMNDFSNSVREFRQVHKDDLSFQFIEEICTIYDNINMKHELGIDALRILVNKLKFRISLYKPF